MKRILLLFLTLALIAFLASAAWGNTAGLGARAIGMGGAYTAVADDEYASYWNPAGITQIKHFDLYGGLNYRGDLDKQKKISDKISDNEMPDLEDLNQNYLLAGYLGFSAKYFSLNMYTDTQLQTSVSPLLEINADIQSSNYGIANIAGTIGRKLSVGINLKTVAAGKGEVFSKGLPDPNNYDFTDSTSFNEFIQELEAYNGKVSYDTGTGTACDLGVLYQLTSRINLGLTLRNIFNQVTTDEGETYTYTVDQDYIDSPTKDEPPLVGTKTDNYGKKIELPQSYVLGLAYRPSENTLLATDIETITNSSNDQTRIHLGVEQTFLKKFIALRLGYFSGDPSGYTAGLGFKLWIFETNMAAISVDDQEEYVLSGSLRF